MENLNDLVDMANACNRRWMHDLSVDGDWMSYPINLADAVVWDIRERWR